MVYNTTYHSSALTTPSEVVYGQKPPPLLPNMPFDSQLDVVDRSLQDRAAALRALTLHLERDQGRMKSQSDKGSTESLRDNIMLVIGSM